MKKSDQILSDIKVMMSINWKRDILWAAFNCLLAIFLAMKGTKWFILPAFFTVVNMWPYLIPWSWYKAYAEQFDEDE